MSNPKAGLVIVVSAMIILQGHSLKAQRLATSEANNDLRLSLSIDSETSQLVFSIQNVGTALQNVPLGINDNLTPSKLYLTITTRDGRLRGNELWMKIDTAATGAPVYSILVSLLKGSTYVIARPMNDFVLMSSDAKPRIEEFPLLLLKSGDLLQAHLRNDMGTCLDGRCPGRLVRCWTGELDSNMFEVR